LNRKCKKNFENEEFGRRVIPENKKEMRWL
jgi:hypothetical protein